MRQTIQLAILLTLACAPNIKADVVDFEDVPPLIIPSTPFSSGGLEFTSTDVNNAIFSSGLSASDNGTQILGWCGSGCGTTQLITVGAPDGELFDVTSIDVGHLSFAGDMSGLGFVEGMTIELAGSLDGGGTVSETLTVFENIFTTHGLTGFTGLTNLQISAPSFAVPGALDATPDPVIDNIVWNSTAIPEPGSFGFVMITILAASIRRKR